MRLCGQERAGNMNALWDRMAEMMPCGKSELTKLKVESHILEHLRDYYGKSKLATYAGNFKQMIFQ